jgi:hypothetical protein
MRKNLMCMTPSVKNTHNALAVQVHNPVGNLDALMKHVQTRVVPSAMLIIPGNSDPLEDAETAGVSNSRSPSMARPSQSDLGTRLLQLIPKH